VCLDSLGWILSTVLVVATIVTIVALFSIGSFTDFDDIEDLLFPVIGTVATLLLGFYLKPSGKEDDKESTDQTASVTKNTTAESQI